MKYKTLILSVCLANMVLSPTFAVFTGCEKELDQTYFSETTVKNVYEAYKKVDEYINCPSQGWGIENPNVIDCRVKCDGQDKMLHFNFKQIEYTGVGSSMPPDEETPTGDDLFSLEDTDYITISDFENNGVASVTDAEQLIEKSKHNEKIDPPCTSDTNADKPYVQCPLKTPTSSKKYYRFYFMSLGAPQQDKETPNNPELENAFTSDVDTIVAAWQETSNKIKQSASNDNNAKDNNAAANNENKEG